MSAVQIWAYLAVAVYLLRYFPREFCPRFRQHSHYQHLVLATLLLLSVLWQIQAGLYDGLQLHFLMITTVVLSHGLPIAMLLSVPPIALLVALGKLPLADAGLFALGHCLLPGLFSYLLFVLSDRYLPRQLFVYIFVAGFISAALSIVLQLTVTSWLLWWDGRYSWALIQDNYLLFAVLAWFPEALLNGAAVTLMSISRPNWLRTFDDNSYLGSR